MASVGSCLVFSLGILGTSLLCLYVQFHYELLHKLNNRSKLNVKILQITIEINMFDTEILLEKFNRSFSLLCRPLYSRPFL